MLTAAPQPSPEQERSNHRRQVVINANYELFVLALAVLQVINSVLWLLLRDQPEEQVVVMITVGISVFFIADGAYRWLRSLSRRQFLFEFRGWLLWLGSLPVPFVAVLRLVWSRHAVGRLQHSDYAAMVDVVARRAQSTLLGAIFAAIVVLEAAATLILGAESKSPSANIQTAGDAVWWTIVTVATVGYGDKYPVTPAGRVIGVFVIIVGVGLFGVLTSFLAQWFLRARQTSREPSPAIDASQQENVSALLARIDALTALIEQQGAEHQASSANLHARLTELEDKLTPDSG